MIIDVFSWEDKVVLTGLEGLGSLGKFLKVWGVSMNSNDIPMGEYTNIVEEILAWLICCIHDCFCH